MKIIFGICRYPRPVVPWPPITAPRRPMPAAAFPSAAIARPQHPVRPPPRGAPVPSGRGAAAAARPPDDAQHDENRPARRRILQCLRRAFGLEPAITALITPAAPRRPRARAAQAPAANPLFGSAATARRGPESPRPRLAPRHPLQAGSRNCRPGKNLHAGRCRRRPDNRCPTAAPCPSPPAYDRPTPSCPPSIWEQLQWVRAVRSGRERFAPGLDLKDSPAAAATPSPSRIWCRVKPLCSFVLERKSARAEDEQLALLV